MSAACGHFGDALLIAQALCFSPRCDTRSLQPQLLGLASLCLQLSCFCTADPASGAPSPAVGTPPELAATGNANLARLLEATAAQAGAAAMRQQEEGNGADDALSLPPQAAWLLGAVSLIEPAEVRALLLCSCSLAYACVAVLRELAQLAESVQMRLCCNPCTHFHAHCHTFPPTAATPTGAPSSKARLAVQVQEGIAEAVRHELQLGGADGPADAARPSRDTDAPFRLGCQVLQASLPVAA